MEAVSENWARGGEMPPQPPALCHGALSCWCSSPAACTMRRGEKMHAGFGAAGWEASQPHWLGAGLWPCTKHQNVLALGAQLGHMQGLPAAAAGLVFGSGERTGRE